VPDTLPTTTPAAASSLQAGQVLLDVREDDEWAAGHAPDAVHVALGRLRPDALPSARQLLLICRSGGRSAQATEVLRRAGYDAINVAGGMTAWAAAGLPVVRTDGRDGMVV
jgi:rhodanese-related sulfurtransferase